MPASPGLVADLVLAALVRVEELTVVLGGAAALVVGDEDVDEAGAAVVERRVLDLVDAVVAAAAALGADVRDAGAHAVAVALGVAVALLVDGLVLGDREYLDRGDVGPDRLLEVDVDVLVVRRPELDLEARRAGSGAGLLRDLPAHEADRGARVMPSGAAGRGQSVRSRPGRGDRRTLARGTRAPAEQGEQGQGDEPGTSADHGDSFAFAHLMRLAAACTLQGRDRAARRPGARIVGRSAPEVERTLDFASPREDGALQRDEELEEVVLLLVGAVQDAAAGEERVAGLHVAARREPAGQALRGGAAVDRHGEELPDLVDVAIRQVGDAAGWSADPERAEL